MRFFCATLIGACLFAACSGGGTVTVQPPATDSTIGRYELLRVDGNSVPVTILIQQADTEKIAFGVITLEANELRLGWRQYDAGLTVRHYSRGTVTSELDANMGEWQRNGTAIQLLPIPVPFPSENLVASMGTDGTLSLVREWPGVSPAKRSTYVFRLTK